MILGGAAAGGLGEAWQWLQSHPALLGWLAILGIGSLVLTALLLPVIIVALPADYFSSYGPRPITRGPLGLLLRIGKNLLGVVFVLAGIAMLVLPGQGLLTILIGMLLLDLPGKRGLTRRLVSRPAIRAFCDRLRQRRGRPPLQLD